MPVPTRRHTPISVMAEKISLGVTRIHSVVGIMKKSRITSIILE